MKLALGGGTARPASEQRERAPSWPVYQLFQLGLLSIYTAADGS